MLSVEFTISFIGTNLAPPEARLDMLANCRFFEIGKSANDFECGCDLSLCLIKVLVSKY